MTKTNKTDKVVSLSRRTVAFENILEDKDLISFLGKDIKVYVDDIHFYVATVEDTMPGGYRACGIDLTGTRCYFMVLKSGIGLSCPSTETKTLAQHYKLWMQGSFLSDVEPPFTEGVSITLSPKVTQLFKKAATTTQTKMEAFKALFSVKTAAEKAKSEAKKLSKTGLVRWSGGEGGPLVISVDEKAIEILFEVYEYSTDWILQKMSGLLVLMGIGGFKAKFKTFEERMNNRNDALK